MSVGFIMLVHTALDRAAQVAAHWLERDCPVVIHVDRKVSRADYLGLVSALEGYEDVRFLQRHACEWGSFSLVAATQEAAGILLRDFPAIGHVYMASGSCLPLRPVEELRDYLAERPETDFIESVTCDDARWTVGGLDSERFTLRFPFSWRRQRWLFDRYVDLQRRLGYSRRLPEGIEPHLGSQWWCLTRRTLESILTAPDRPALDRYFKRAWIPDESYFQTVARRYSLHVESRSLTLWKFDFQGKPHVFYDDHLPLLRRSDCFVARKIWPRADLLYDTFLGDRSTTAKRAEPQPQKIDRLFSKAVDLRTRGRPGLYMQSRYPNWDWENGKTASEYFVFQGFSDLYTDFETWLERRTGNRVHGHLFHKTRVQFSGRARMFNGCLSDSARLRDHHPNHFLSSLIWNTQGERQCFQFGPGDSQQISGFMAADKNALISVISGAWIVGLFHSDMDFLRIRRIAAHYQRTEAAFLDQLRSVHVRARVRVWSLSEYLEQPVENLQSILDDLTPREYRRLTELPRPVDLTGLGRFLQQLKNAGMRPYLMGDIPVEPVEASPDGHVRPHLDVVR